jgi:hypothetical protein
MFFVLRAGRERRCSIRRGDSPATAKLTSVGSSRRPGMTTQIARIPDAGLYLTIAAWDLRGLRIPFKQKLKAVA